MWVWVLHKGTKYRNTWQSWSLPQAHLLALCVLLHHTAANGRLPWWPGFIFSLCHKGLVTVKRRYKYAQYYQGLRIQVLCKITTKLPARYEILHVVGTQVFIEQCESTLGLFTLPFTSSRVIAFLQEDLCSYVHSFLWPNLGWKFPLAM